MKIRTVKNLAIAVVCQMSLVWSIALYSAGSVPTDLALELGDVKVIDVGEVARVAVGNDDIVTVSVLQTGKMMLIPSEAGKTEVKVWKTGERLIEFNVSVYPKDLQELLNEVQSLIADYDDLQARLVDDKVVLKGTIDPDQSEGFNAVISAYPSVVSLVTQQRSKKQMISLKVQVLEVDKRYTKEIGIQWGDSVNGPNVSTIGNIYENNFYRVIPEDDEVDFLGISGLIPIGDEAFYPYAGLASSLTSRIQLLQDNGAGRILAEPTLSTQAGTPAAFLAGGEIPYATVNELGQTVVQFQQYGIQLDILPVIDGRGNIISDVSAEVSAVDASVAVQGVPGLLTRRTQSTVSLKPGQTIAISGLLSANDNRNIDAIPLLGDIPILGALFRSKEFQEQRTEIVFLVTPELVDPSNGPQIDPVLLDQLEELKEIMGGDSTFSEHLAD